jgi:hypothetical protein
LDTEEAAMVEEPRPSDAMSREAGRRDRIEKALREAKRHCEIARDHLTGDDNPDVCLSCAWELDTAIERAEEALRPE